MMAYYNEFDPFAAAWLRNLIDADLIPFGVVDERDMRDVRPSDVTGFTQCHFFAGIGGWAYALRLAGWPDDRPVWTGSPPCQPFSNAGKGLGTGDDRHLAPHFLELVRAVRPPVLFGEQVAAAIKKDAWLDDLLDELEDQGYSTGAAVLPACSVGAPHIRQRIFFIAQGVADDGRIRRERGTDAGRQTEWRAQHAGADVGLDNRERTGLEGQRRGHPTESGHRQDEAGSVAEAGESGGLADNGRGRREVEMQHAGGCGSTDCEREAGITGSCGASGGLADTTSRRLGNGDAQRGGEHGLQPEGGSSVRQGHQGPQPDTGPGVERPDSHHSGWSDPDWLFCRDGKWRPVESGTFPLAHGVSARVGRLRGYGNAIVPQVAAEVIRVLMDKKNPA